MVQKRNNSGPVFLKKVPPGRGEPAAACYTCRHRPCCGCFPVPLTGAEAERLQVDPWHLVRGRRVLARGPDGLCFYLDNGRCRIWKERPAACRVHNGANEKILPECSLVVSTTIQSAEEVVRYRVTVGTVGRPGR
jgi:Fe-S-cluster containining protein